MCLDLTKFSNFLIYYDEKLQKRKASQPVGVKTCGCTFKNLPNLPAWKLIKELGFLEIFYQLYLELILVF